MVATNMDKVLQLIKEDEERRKARENGEGLDSKYFSMTEPSHRVRVLPYKDVPWVERRQHWIAGKAYACLAGNCPICARMKDLQRGKSKEESNKLFSKYGCRKSYLHNILDYADGKVKVFSANPSTRMKFFEFFSNPEIGDFTALDDSGRDIILSKKIGSNGLPDWGGTMPSLTASAVPDAEAVMAARHDLESEAVMKQTTEELISVAATLT